MTQVRGWCLAVAVVGAVCLAIGACAGPAAAASNSPAAAKAAGDNYISSLIPSLGGQAGACNVKTRSGFFAKRASYLASCASTDGTLQVFTILDARNAALNTKSPYLKARLKVYCGVGRAYGSGVQGKFVNIYAGTGAGQQVAQDLLQGLSENIQETPGYVKPFAVC